MVVRVRSGFRLRFVECHHEGGGKQKQLGGSFVLCFLWGPKLRLASGRDRY